MTTVIDPKLSRAQLIAIARTGEPAKGVGRMRALATLQQRPSKDSSDIFLEILKDKKEAPRARHMAVMGIYRLDGEQARGSLLAAARTADAAIAAPIAVALGRIGEAGDLAVIERLEKIAPGHARNRVEFAARLLAYRHHLDGYEVRSPAKDRLQILGRKGYHPITFAAARGKELEYARQALADEPFLADITTEKAIRIECEPNQFLWLWAKDAVASRLAGAEKRKGVLNLLLLKSEFDESYALSLVGLVTPSSRGQYRISLHRPENGEIMYFGTAEADGSFELVARAWPGLAPVDVKGRATPGGLEIATAKSAVNVLPAKVPRAEGGAKSPKKAAPRRR